MQCQGALRTPLRNIVKNIGVDNYTSTSTSTRIVRHGRAGRDHPRQPATSPGPLQAGRQHLPDATSRRCAHVDQIHERSQRLRRRRSELRRPLHWHGYLWSRVGYDPLSQTGRTRDYATQSLGAREVAADESKASDTPEPKDDAPASEQPRPVQGSHSERQHIAAEGENEAEAEAEASSTSHVSEEEPAVWRKIEHGPNACQIGTAVRIRKRLASDENLIRHVHDPRQLHLNLATGAEKAADGPVSVEDYFSDADRPDTLRTETALSVMEHSYPQNVREAQSSIVQKPRETHKPDAKPDDRNPATRIKYYGYHESRGDIHLDLGEERELPADRPLEEKRGQEALATVARESDRGKSMDHTSMDNHSKPYWYPLSLSTSLTTCDAPSLAGTPPDLTEGNQDPAEKPKDLPIDPQPTQDVVEHSTPQKAQIAEHDSGVPKFVKAKQHSSVQRAKKQQKVSHTTNEENAVHDFLRKIGESSDEPLEASIQGVDVHPGSPRTGDASGPTVASTHAGLEQDQPSPAVSDHHLASADALSHATESPETALSITKHSYTPKVRLVQTLPRTIEVSQPSQPGAKTSGAASEIPPEAQLNQPLPATNSLYQESVVEDVPDSDFESAVQSAARVPRAGKRSVAIERLKAGQQFDHGYYYAYDRSLRSAERNRQRTYELQTKRSPYPNSDDWRLLLERLEEHTPSTSEIFLKRMETVRLPEGIAAVFRGNAGAAIAEIMQRTGSQVQVVKQAANWIRGNQPFSALTLLGSKQSNDRALALMPNFVEVLTLDDLDQNHKLTSLKLDRSEKDAFGATPAEERGTESTSTTDVTDDLSATDIEALEDTLDHITGTIDQVAIPVRAVWAVDRKAMYDAMSELSRGLSDKSALSPTAYIEDITHPMPRLVGKKLYDRKVPGSSTGHVDVVTESLLELFHDPEVIANITSSAVTRTIQFLVKNGRFPEFRTIYSKLQDGGYVFDADNFNACLTAAAKAGDVRNFRVTLTNMWRNGVHPVPMTWALLHELMCRRFPLESGVVLEAIRKRGFLLDNHTAKHCAASMVRNDLTSHLALRGDLRSFYRLYDNRFGLSFSRTEFNWLTLDVAKQMLVPLLSAGKQKDALGVLEEMRQRAGREVALDTSVLNTFLAASLRKRDPRSAIDCLRLFRVGDHGALVPDEITYMTLFALAWRLRRWNMLRVIWRYACVAGHATPVMLHRVYRGLIAFKPEEISATHIWRAWAGKFVVGVDFGLVFTNTSSNAEKRQRKTLFYDRKDLVRFASDAALPSGTPACNERITTLARIRDRDLGEVTSSKPVEPFTDLLEVALQKDLEWETTGLGSPKGFQQHDDMFAEMMKQGINVPMKAGNFAKTSRPWELPWELGKYKPIGSS